MIALLTNNFSPWMYWLFCGACIACAASVPRSVVALDRMLVRRPAEPLSAAPWSIEPWSGAPMKWPRALTWLGMTLLGASFVALMVLCRLLAS